MTDYQENSGALLSVSSWENRDSFVSSNDEAFEGDEEFYEEIEAPKFVDFTVPDHYCPDDRYWFCLRVGCDQKHEDEMDSEAIYNKFVLRVMSARSPNVRLRKALDRNASRKCPLSAPPKPSNPRSSRMAIVSSISKKMAGDKEKPIGPLSKLRYTPVAKTKPVAAKYLTTPRNKKCTQDENSFRSVQNPKPTNIEMSKSRTVAKALVFHSPKKTVKVKTSVELRTPVSKLCKEMNKLEITSKPSKVLSSSRSSRRLSNRKVQRKAEEPLGSKSCTNQESKYGESIKSTTKGKNEERHESEQQSAQKVAEEACMSSMVPPSTHDSDLAVSVDSKREGNCLDLEESDNSRPQETTNIHEHEYMDGDNKENDASANENRMHNKNLKQNGRKILDMHDQCGQVRKKVTQAQDKNLISFSSPVVKLKKPKATNPKPFRLRTDERGILKEANLERRTDHTSTQSESVIRSTLSEKLQMKQGNDIQGLKIPKGQERSKPTAAVAPESKNHRDKKSISSPLESNAMQRLEKFRRIKSPLQKHSIRPQGLISMKNEMTSFLVPGQKLDVIHENSPEALLELKRAGKTNVPPRNDAAACSSSRSSSRGRRPITEPNFHGTHVPRTCTKKLK